MTNQIVKSLIAIIVSGLTFYVLFFFGAFAHLDTDGKPPVLFTIIAVIVSLAILVYSLKKVWKENPPNS